MNLRLYAVKKNFRRCVSLNFRLYAVKKNFRRCVSIKNKKKYFMIVILVVRRKSMKNDGSRLKFNGKIGAP